MFALLTPFFVFSAFLLFLLVSISTPVVHSIYLFRLAANASVNLLDASASAAVRFGVWGYCISAVDVSVVGLSNDVVAGSCSKAKLGYDFDATVQDALRAEGVDPNAISKGLTIVLVLHPIVCGLAFLLLLTTLFAMIRRTSIRRGASFCIIFYGLLTALLATMTFLFDVILVAVVRSHIKSDTGGIVALGWGNAVWLTLGATIALWVALVTSCLAVLKKDKVRMKTETY